MRRHPNWITAGLQISVFVCSVSLNSETEGWKAKRWSHIKAPLHKILTWLSLKLFFFFFLKNTRSQNILLISCFWSCWQLKRQNYECMELNLKVTQHIPHAQPNSTWPLRNMSLFTWTQVCVNLINNTAHREVTVASPALALWHLSAAVS